MEKKILFIGKHTKIFDFNGNLTSKARIRKALYESKGKKTIEKIAEETGTQISKVVIVKQRIRKELELLKKQLIEMQRERKPAEQIAAFHRSIKEHEEALQKQDGKKPAPELTENQKLLLKQARTLLLTKIQQITRSLKIYGENAEDFKVLVESKLPFWIVSHNRYLEGLKSGDQPKSLENALYYRIDMLARGFITDLYSQRMGASHHEAALLASLSKRIKKLRGLGQNAITAKDAELFFDKAFNQAKKELKTFDGVTSQQARKLVERFVENEERRKGGERFQRRDH